MGTGRDKMGAARVNADFYRLDIRELKSLPRKSGLIERLCYKLPNDCGSEWVNLNLSETNYTGEDILLYLEDLEFKQGRIGAKKAFRLAGCLGRQYGDGFILLGIADGKESSEPVDLDRIQSIEWLKVYDRDRIYPDAREGTYDPEYYRVYSEGGIWHRDRVLRFPGRKVLSRYKIWNDSAIQTFFDSWSQWEQGVAAGAQMLVEWDQAVFRMEGLSELLLQDMRSGTTDNQSRVAKRLESADLNRSLYRAILLDTKESMDYLSHNYTNADQIMERLKDRLASESDLPRWVLFNEGSVSATGLSGANTAGLAQRYEWAAAKQDWCNNVFVPPLTKLVRYAIAAKNSPSRGDSVRFKIESASEPTLTASEKMELQLNAAKRDEINIKMGIYSAEEARSQYEQPQFTGQIDLSDRTRIANEAIDSIRNRDSGLTPEQEKLWKDALNVRPSQWFD